MMGTEHKTHKKDTRSTRMAMAAFLCILCFLCSVPALACSEIAVVEPRIYLKDLQLKGAENLNGLISTSPAPGQFKVLEAGDIDSRLEVLGIKKDQYGIQLPDCIRVQREAQTLEPWQIEERVRNEFLPELPWEEAQLQEIGIFDNVVLPAGKLELTFQMPPRTDVARPFFLNVSFRVNGQIVKRAFWRTVLTISHTVAVAARDLDAGKPIGTDDIKWEKRRLSSTLRMPLGRADSFEDKKPRFRVPLGQIMTEDMLVAVLLIKRGDNIALVFEDERIHITAPGLSLGTGSRGERIRVMNATSRKELTGEIIDAKSVRVLF
jgi:flagella basal body P-ring formation protein FlgA